jgi:hypothetical protein
MPRRTLDLLSQKLVQGVAPFDARQETVLEISDDLASELRHRSLEDSLSSIGIETTLAAEIRNLAASEDPFHIAGAFQIIVGGGGGGAGGVPTAECLRRHLPIGRRPTQDEVDAAIKVCRSKSSAVQVG